MKIILDIGHPKDVNVFRNVVSELQIRGHEIKIVARAKENTKRIIKEYGLICEFGPYYKSIAGKALGLFRNDIWLYSTAKKFHPDIFISPGSPYSAQVSKLLGKPHLAFIDTEIAKPVIKLMLPFTDTVYTSTSFYLNLGTKQKRFNGYYELAYLHPKYFTPKKEVIAKYGLSSDYIILRLSALSSHHDIGASGFSFRTERELKEYIEVLEEYGKVIISSEVVHWKTIEEYQLRFEPNELHDILFYSKLYIGEGATMASEAAILGVPSIYISNTHRGYLDELESYGLAFTIQNRVEALKKAVSIFKDNSQVNKYKEKRRELLEDKVDTVEFIVKEIEKYIQI